MFITDLSMRSNTYMSHMEILIKFITINKLTKLIVLFHSLSLSISFSSSINGCIESSAVISVSWSGGVPNAQFSWLVSWSTGSARLPWTRWMAYHSYCHQDLSQGLGVRKILHLLYAVSFN